MVRIRTTVIMLTTLAALAACQTTQQGDPPGTLQTTAPNSPSDGADATPDLDTASAAALAERDDATLTDDDAEAAAVKPAFPTAPTDTLVIVGSPYFAPLPKDVKGRNVVTPTLAETIAREARMTQRVLRATGETGGMALFCRDERTIKVLSDRGDTEAFNPDLVLLSRAPSQRLLSLCADNGIDVRVEQIATYRGGLPEDYSVRGLWAVYAPSQLYAVASKRRALGAARRAIGEGEYRRHFNPLF